MSKITGKDDLMESFHNVLYRRKGMVSAAPCNLLC